MDSSSSSGHLEFDDVVVTSQRQGHGPPVMLVHATAFVSWYDPLIEQLTDVATLRYRRRLRKPAAGPYRPLSVAEDAATGVRLMERVGWQSAHVVGHSYGALVALQMAIDTPERVASVALLEPAVRGVSSSAQIAAALQPVVAAYQSGDTAAAVDGFLRHVCGDGYRAELDRALPCAFEEAIDEADLFFQSETPAVQRFSFGPADAERVSQPVLNVLGTESAPRFVEGSELVQSWFPRAERLSVPRAGHLLMVQNPSAVAHGLLDFFASHPLGSTSVAAGSALGRQT